MPEKSRDPKSVLRALMDALAESVAQASDDEVLEDSRERGEDPAAAAESVRALLLKATTDFQQRRLHEAQSSYERRVKSMGESSHSLPDTPEGRRALLLSILAGNQALRSAMTAQFRDFRDMSDADVESHLRQLIELGGLADDKGDSAK